VEPLTVEVNLVIYLV